MDIKKKNLKVIAVVVILFIIAYFYFTRKEEIYKFEDNGFHYAKNRGKVDYDLNFKETKGEIDIYKVNFQSREFMNFSTRIYGLVFVPREGEDFPGVVLVPGGGGTKEVESRLAMLIAEKGYAVITIDQRGIGETGGYYLGVEQDYGVFAEGKEPIQHLSVYDILRTSDVLREIEGVDKDNIAVIGESMGARYSIIAAAEDDRIKGVIAISASGFNVQDEGKAYSPYLLSIDPDRYIGKISPRYVMMLHGTNDSVIKLSEAQRTFSLAGEPKRFFIAQECGHGYCDDMHDELKEDLGIIFGR